MNWINHFKLEGLHAPFSASQSSWLRYTDDKLVNTYLNKQASERGTQLHAWAKQTIDLGLKQSNRSKKAIYAYVNDAIGFKMRTEVVLYYSDYFFGTADAISFRDNFLRIHDLKNGIGPVHMDQLKVYAAYFCLEYKIKPGDIDIELRIYQDVQDDGILCCAPEVDEIAHIMDIIIHNNKIIERMEHKEV